MADMLRLQKFLAEAGVASRRGGEQLIREGRIKVNGAIVTQLGTKVDPDRDAVTFDGAVLRSKRKLYVALNKPPGVVTTRKDDQGRVTVSDLLPVEWRNLFPVGRLDCESEGLIFLTNDGDFCLRLTHPRYGVHKFYCATVEGRVEPAMLKRFTEGLRHEGELLRAEGAHLIEANNTHSVVELELAEGKNREVRRLFEAVGLNVSRLQRTQIGRIRLGTLRPGRWRALTAPEIKTLLGPT